MNSIPCCVLLKRLVDALEALIPGGCWDEGERHYAEGANPSALIKLLERRHGQLLASHSDGFGRVSYIGHAMANTILYLAGILEASTLAMLSDAEVWKYSRRYRAQLDKFHSLSIAGKGVALSLKDQTDALAKAVEAYDEKETAPVSVVFPERPYDQDGETHH